mmetsp:Transcript_13225/g.25251  ORF Transcript_13225/g.25251 Transcript_13225/m.25251 type:complete len:204 (-) Transcript_13225:1341-1952(-)
MITPAKLHVIFFHVDVMTVHAISRLFRSRLFDAALLLQCHFCLSLQCRLRSSFLTCGFLLHELLRHGPTLFLAAFATHAKGQLRPSLACDLAHVATPQRQKFRGQPSIVPNARPREQTLRRKFLKRRTNTTIISILDDSVVPGPCREVCRPHHDVTCVAEHGFHVVARQLCLVVVYDNLATFLHALRANTTLASLLGGFWTAI